MTGTFYTVGVGPGDPELITLKAVHRIQESDVIAVPNSGASENTALTIAKQYIRDKTILPCPMPMIRDEDKLAESHASAAEKIAELLDEGRQVSFLVLGDPSIYASAMYVHRRLTKKGYDTAMIPGVPSFCAAAASLNTSLCEGGEPLHLIPASYEENSGEMDLKGTKVFMKSGKSLGALKEKLKQANQSAVMVECASMENEKIYQTLEEIDENAGYFSLVIVKE